MTRRFTPPIAAVDAAQSAPARQLLRVAMHRTLDFFASHEVDNLQRLRAHLRQLLDELPGTAQAQHLRTAHALLGVREAAFQKAFRLALQQRTEEELLLALPNAPAPRSPDPLADPLHGMTLSLVDMSEVDRIMKIDRVALRFNQHHEASLTALTERLAALLELPSPNLARNPFRPDVFVHAVVQAWAQDGFDAQAGDDLLMSLQPQHCVDLGVLYRELDTLLERAGVAAAPALTIKRDAADASQPVTPAAALRAPAPAANRAPPSPAALSWRPPQPATNHPAFSQCAGAAPTPSPRDLSPLAPAANLSPMLAQMRQVITAKARQFLRQIGWSTGPKVHTGALPTLWPPANLPLLGYLGDLQACAVTSASMPVLQNDSPANHNILRSMRDLAEVRRAPDLDRGTVDALAEVFDYVFADQDIPVQLKYIIGRLQIPVLKAAMIDRDFFLSSEHPARRLVDTLARASIAWAPEKGETDPLYTRIEQTVKRVLHDFKDDLTLFGDLLQQFTEFLFETEQQAQAVIKKTAQEEHDREIVGQALVRADRAVHNRLKAQPKALPVVRFLIPFLTLQWRDVLIQATLQTNGADAAWDAALATMDQLIWSTEPKTQSHERSQLVSILPALVRSLNEALDVIEWTGEPRATFTRRLITTHMLAIRMTQAPAVDASAVEREERAGQEAMDALDARLAPHLSNSHDEFDRQAQGFKRGLWFDFIMEDGLPHRCLLSWVSPMRTRLLFTNREGFDAFVRSEREVAALLRLQRLRVVETTPIIERALTQLMADLPEQLAA